MPQQTLKRILIVDDAAILASAISLRLQCSGYECAVATSGEEALAMIERGFDLIITDIEMPGFDGIELIQRIRSRSCVPMMVMTGYMPVKQSKRLAKEGITVIDKPFDTRALLRAVVAAVDADTPAVELACAA